MDQTPMLPEDPRTRLAGERTSLAWIRTGLAMMGFGFVVARFGLFLREIAAAGNIPHPAHTGFSLWIGSALVLAGVAVNLLAAREHLTFLQVLKGRLPSRPPRMPLTIVVNIFLASIGAIMVVYLILIAR